MSSIGIFTAITDPDRRGDCWRPAIECYSELADQVVIIDGGSEELGVLPSNVSVVKSEWPHSFSWNLIGKKFQLGYESLDTSWAVHADLDFIFHEKSIEQLRKVLEQNNDEPALSMWKYQFILPDRYNLKSRLVLAVNKAKFGDRIRFDSGGDLCQPSLDGLYINPSLIPESRIAFYCYEKMTKNREQVEDDVKRMADAWYRYFMHYKLGTDKTAYREWLKMVVGRFKKPQQHILLHEHPVYVQDTIRGLKPTQWGYSGFDNLEVNDYAKEKEKSK